MTSVSTQRRRPPQTGSEDKRAQAERPPPRPQGGRDAGAAPPKPWAARARRGPPRPRPAPLATRVPRRGRPRAALTVRFRDAAARRARARAARKDSGRRRQRWAARRGRKTRRTHFRSVPPGPLAREFRSPAGGGAAAGLPVRSGQFRVRPLPVGPLRPSPSARPTLAAPPPFVRTSPRGDGQSRLSLQRAPPGGPRPSSRGHRVRRRARADEARPGRAARAE